MLRRLEYLFNVTIRTEWSAIWSEIVRVISKLNEHAARVRFEITNYDFRPKLHKTKFNYHFITPILKSHRFFFVNINILFHFHSDGLKKGCNLEQKIVQLVSKLHC